MTELQPIQRLSRDLRTAAKTLSTQEARYLVDSYYTIQDYRIQSANQIRAMGESEEPCSVIQWQFDQMAALENQIKAALDKWSNEQPLGRWARSIPGIGPVLAAGLLAHINIDGRNSVGQLWAFAGLDPTRTWGKGEKRPHNARLKVLCWKIGESFVKVSSNDADIYGKVYQQRKQYEAEKNERSEYAEQAAAMLTKKRFGDDTKAKAFYQAGKLPPGHIHARAKRYAVKLFLAHYFEVAYRLQYGTEPPMPYPIAVLGHKDYIPAPNLEAVS